MKLSSLKQQIEELDANAENNNWEEAVKSERLDAIFVDNGPELLRRLLVAEDVVQTQVRDDGHNKGCSYDAESFDPSSDFCTCGRTCTKALATIRGEEDPNAPRR